ncbi:Chromodomain-helicase-DNA-binding protein 1-like [Bulinus truncatus]|nr:Chromodomain-helicase-DNA-binding protein 1-like [Bulinus truncatus]
MCLSSCSGDIWDIYSQVVYFIMVLIVCTVLVINTFICTLEFLKRDSYYCAYLLCYFYDFVDPIGIADPRRCTFYVFMKMAEISKTDKITNKDLQTLNWNEELKLHPYQLDGTSWLLSCYNNGRGCILSDEMGLGKTCQVIAMLTVIKGRKKLKDPHLIACPRSVLENWKLEFQRFSPSVDVVIYTGDKEERVELARNVRDSYNKSEFDVLLTTYEMCLKDSSFLRSMSWDVLIVDEGHRLKNSESLLHQTLQEWDIRVHVLLTGTPVQNNLQELYSLLNFVDRSKFRLSGAEKFVEKYSSKCPDVKELHQLLAPYLLRRTKEMVMPDLPEKCDIILYHGLTSLQKKLYKAILGVMKTENWFSKRFETRTACNLGKWGESGMYLK